MKLSPQELDLFRKTEENLLGALFLEGAAENTQAIETVKRILAVTDFIPDYLDQLHRRIFQAMLDSPRTDYLTVSTTMSTNGSLEKGDIPYMVGLCAEVIGIDYEWYARQVIDNAKIWRTEEGVRIKFKGGI